MMPPALAQLASADNPSAARPAPERPRLWVVCEEYGVFSQVWIRRQVQRLTGFDLRVVCRGADASEHGVDDEPPIDVVPGTAAQEGASRWLHRLAASPSGNFFRAPRGQAATLDRMLREHRPDVILAHFGAMALWVLPAAAKHDVPVVAHFHGLDLSSSLRNRWYRWSLQRCLSRFAAVVVVGSHQRQWMLSQGLDPQSVHLIPCGVPSSWFTPPADGKRRDPDLVVVINARLVPWKGVDVGLRAFAEAVSRGHRARLEVIGDGPERDSLERLSAALGVTDRVSFLGRLAPEAVRERLRAADVFVQPSRVGDNGWVEGFGVSISEASACGLAVVATRTGGIPDQVVDGQTGRLVEPGDVKATADALCELLGEEERRRAMGRAGRQLMQTHFDTDTMVERLSRVLACVTERRVRSKPRTDAKPAGDHQA